MAENPTYDTCPRCGHDTFRTDRPVMNALSRRDNETYVCSPCGTDEAMENFLRGEPQPWFSETGVAHTRGETIGGVTND